MTEAEVSEAASVKFNEGEEKLKEIAKLTMLLFRDFPKLDKAAFEKRVLELRKAITRYEGSNVKIWKLQHELREKEFKYYEELKERSSSQRQRSEELVESLHDELREVRLKRKQLQDLEVLAKEINTKKPRSETKALITDTLKQAENIQAEEQQLNENNERRAKKAMLMMM